jgi:tetratricopeptide (TPR) repeat protein
LKGQGLLTRRARSVKEAVELFREAIRQDSLFAPAYSGLSMALALAPWFEHVPSQEVHDEIFTAARRALTLDSTLSAPHVAVGLAHWQAYDWIRAAAEFKTAVRLDPRNVEARVQYGRLLRASGQHAEALAQLREARLQDPASALVLSHIAGVYLRSGQLDSALVEARRAMAMDSTNLTTLLFTGVAYFRNNRPQEGRAVMGPLGDNDFYGYELAKSGEVDSARQMIRRMEAAPKRRNNGGVAYIYLGLGDTANALSALERATDAKELWAISSDLQDSAFDGIRRSARYRAILKRVGLTDYLASLGR